MTPRVRSYAREEAKLFGCRQRDVLGRCRLPEVVAARRSVIHRLLADGFNHSQIGRWLKRDHTTIWYHAHARVDQP